MPASFATVARSSSGVIRKVPGECGGHGGRGGSVGEGGGGGGGGGGGELAGGTKGEGGLAGGDAWRKQVTTTLSIAGSPLEE